MQTQHWKILHGHHITTLLPKYYVNKFAILSFAVSKLKLELPSTPWRRRGVWRYRYIHSKTSYWLEASGHVQCPVTLDQGKGLCVCVGSVASLSTSDGRTPFCFCWESNQESSFVKPWVLLIAKNKGPRSIVSLTNWMCHLWNKILEHRHKCTRRKRLFR